MENTPSSIEGGSGKTRNAALLLLVCLAPALFDLFRLLSYTWESREQYSFGWFVPFLAIYLFLLRWADRPPASASTCNPILGVLPLLLLLPLRVIFEINVDWPLISWAYTLGIVAATWFAVWLAGGRAWAAHFAFPVCFVLVSVAWPTRIEKTLTQNLMQVVATFTVEILSFCDIPALQRGNLIEVNSGVVGVDEACSGIRSFQSTWMAGLFMGELYRMSIGRRVTIVLAGLASAFCFNVSRTWFLSWQASNNGVVAVDKWHDKAGVFVMVTGFVWLWIMAMWLRGSKQGAGGVPASRTTTSHSEFRITRPLKIYLCTFGTIWLISRISTEGWYAYGDSRYGDGFGWKAAFPTNVPSFQHTELAPRVVQLLRHDSGGAGSWSPEPDREWNMYFFRWNPRPIEAVMLSRAHRPDVCLPAVGLRQVGDSTPIKIEAAGFEIPFRAYTYESDGRVIHVFFSQWEDGIRDQSGLLGSNQIDRIQSVLLGRRVVGMQTLEFILRGYPNLEQATQALKVELPGIVQAETTTKP